MQNIHEITTVEFLLCILAKLCIENVRAIRRKIVQVHLLLGLVKLELAMRSAQSLVVNREFIRGITSDSYFGIEAFVLIKSLRVQWDDVRPLNSLLNITTVFLFVVTHVCVSVRSQCFFFLFSLHF